MVFGWSNMRGMFWYIDCGIMRCRQERRFLTSFVIPRIFVKENSRGIQKNKTLRNSANPAFRFFYHKATKDTKIHKEFFNAKDAKSRKVFCVLYSSYQRRLVSIFFNYRVKQRLQSFFSVYLCGLCS